jgi:hypothetical protein
MTIEIQTLTVYSYSGVTLTTYGTIIIPAVPKPPTVPGEVTASEILPSSYSLPSNLAIVSIS